MKEILLSGKYGRDKVALVDDEDFGWLSTYSWGDRCEGLRLHKVLRVQEAERQMATSLHADA